MATMVSIGQPRPELAVVALLRVSTMVLGEERRTRMKVEVRRKEVDPHIRRQCSFVIPRSTEFN
ncbi:hypothetical protein SESBI_12852 [Sesbania bispinosa]|nr:hypothetical protein SESBI_12852 [Sesbania bispinosa]